MYGERDFLVNFQPMARIKSQQRATKCSRQRREGIVGVQGVPDDGEKELLGDKTFLTMARKNCRGARGSRYRREDIVGVRRLPDDEKWPS